MTKGCVGLSSIVWCASLIQPSSGADRRCCAGGPGHPIFGGCGYSGEEMNQRIGERIAAIVTIAGVLLEAAHHDRCEGGRYARVDDIRGDRRFRDMLVAD